MEIGFYIEGLNNFASYMFCELKDIGNKVNTSDCICKYPLESLEKLVFVHPEDSDQNECWTRLKKNIMKFTDSHFYIFAIQAPEREEGIGQYPNVTYITTKNSRKIFENLMKGK